MAVQGRGRAGAVVPAKEISPARYGLAFLAILVWGVYGVAIEPDSEFGAFGRWVCALQIIGFIGLVAHEAGHALVGQLVGFRVFAVVLGEGPTLAVGKVGNARVELRLFTVTGYTSAATASRRAYRLRSVLFILAGPLVTATFIPLGYALIDAGYPSWGSASVLYGIIALFSNLIPMRTVVEGHKQWNDGGLLIQSATMRRATVTAVVDAYGEVEHHHLLTAAGPEVALARSEVEVATTDDPAARRRYGEALILSGRYEEAREVFAERLIQHDLDPHQIAVAANNLAYANVMLRREELLPEADRWSIAALHALPDEPAVVSTRGAVLVALGRASEGRPMLEQAAAAPRRLESGAETACWLALAALDLGDGLEARRQLRHAERANPACCLLPEVRERVAQADLFVLIDDLARSGTFDGAAAPDAVAAGVEALRVGLGRQGEALLSSASRYVVDGPPLEQIDAELRAHDPRVSPGTAAALRAALIASSSSSSSPSNPA